MSNEPIRILHVNRSINKNSGIMSVIMNYYRNIDKEKIQFDFLYFSDYGKDSYEDEIKSLGGRIYKIPKPSLRLKFKKNLRNIYKIIMKDYNYKIMHIHTIYMASFFAPLAKEIGFESIIGHSHNTKYSDHFIGKIRNFFLSVFMNYYFDYFFACTKEAAVFSFGKKRFTNNEVYILKNSIEVGKFQYRETDKIVLSKKYNLESNKVLGHVGRFAKQKNHKFILKIFRKILKTDSTWRLFLIGEGPLKVKIKKRINRLGLNEKVIILGYQNDIHRYYSLFDVFILPSKYEGLGIVGIEAQTSGLLTLISDKLPEDLKISNFKALSLKRPNDWVVNVTTYECYERKSQIIHAINKGYNISTEAKKLEVYYKDIMRRIL